MKKVIGIVAKYFLKDYVRKNVFIRDELKQAILDNGALAIGILPPLDKKVKAINNYKESLNQKEKDDLIDQLKLCDGIILQGGAFSSEYECFIARYCHEFNIPILGICAGMHNMVRAVGGKVKKGIDGHNCDIDYVHDIDIDKNSILYDIVGKENIMVNSRHKSYTSDFGILNPIAYSKDGIVEAVQDKNKTFYLALQFHPESLYKIDENMNDIFKYFIDICNNKC